MVRNRRKSAPAAARNTSNRALGAAVGLLVDRLVGEPPVPPQLHPVALFGSMATQLERRLYADRATRGAAYTGLGVALAGGVGWAVRSPALASYLAVSGRGLHTAAAAVGRALDHGDLDQARRLLPGLVGRDPSQLDAEGIARAVVESVAENTTDAIVAPVFWTVVGGAPAVFLHRAADTLDSMVGYRDARYQRFGTAAARLDDAMAWLPARCTAALVALVRPSRAAAVWSTVRADAAAHPSPNAGMAEAAFAGALGVQLGGTNRYGDVAEARPRLGSGPTARPADIALAIRLSRDVSYALAGILALGGALGARRRRRAAR
jgi:adenosylcobinamide-phosphate synthase